MYKFTLALCLLCATLALAQTERNENIQQQRLPQTSAATPAPLTKKAAAEKKQQQERGLKLLEIAEAQAAGLEGGMRAYAFWQLARSYQGTDKAKAVELLEGAMTASHDMEEDDKRGDTRARLQQQILRDMVPLAPERAEELLSQLKAENREPVLNALLTYYEKNKDLDHGLELVYRIGQEKEIPYEAAGRIMAALPPERSGDLLQLFTVAFASYRDHDHPGVTLGGSDFGGLVPKFWQKLPPNVVHDAIRELLKQASEQKDSTNISLSNDKGSAAFNSYYDFRLFQLLPVLKHIDESEADELLKKNQEANALLAKYPEGMGTFAPNVPGPDATGKPDAKPDGGKPESSPARSMGTNMMISRGSGGGRPAGPDPMMLEQQQVRKIMADADEHPDTALVQAAALSDPNTRADVYQMIARATAKKKPSTARSAIDKLLGTVDQVQEMIQLNLVRAAAELYLQMGETEDAKKVVERGFKLADKLQAVDTNADDPNKALKAYWPSAEAWRSFTRLAGQISPTWAMAQVNEISDPEMKVLAQTALAQQWLDVSRGSTTVMSSSKKGDMMSISNVDRQ